MFNNSNTLTNKLYWDGPVDLKDVGNRLQKGKYILHGSLSGFISLTIYPQQFGHLKSVTAKTIPMETIIVHVVYM